MLTVGGDHSIAAATIPAIRKKHNNLKIIWVDAHPDAADPGQKTPHILNSQNYHGMPLGHLMGVSSAIDLNGDFSFIKTSPSINFSDVVLIGIRDIDPDEYISL